MDEDTKARVKRLADPRQRTPHWLMREAIMTCSPPAVPT
ncbi:MAG: CopG family ribbon-helix-helix protein [Limnohabitans sp.]